LTVPDSAFQRLERFMRPRGMRMTSARREILSHAFSMQDHFTADELVSLLKRRRAHVSRASAYRALALFVESGVVRKMALGDGPARYEAVRDWPPHDHLVCTRCGAVEPLEDRDVDSVLQAASTKRGFVPERRSLNVFGWCSECLTAQKGRAQARRTES